MQTPVMIAEVQAAGERAVAITIHDVIGKSSERQGVTSDNIAQKLIEAGDVERIVVSINSVGGHVDQGLAIYNLLREHPARVTVKIQGLAASSASVIAMAGDEIEMPTSALMMIHSPAYRVAGTSTDMRKAADVLDKWTEAFINAYASRANISREEIAAMMEAETWLTAGEAKAKGFVTSVSDQEPVRAAFDLGQFSNAPAEARALVLSAEGPDTETVESQAPEAGLSIAMVDQFTAMFGAKNGLAWLREGVSYPEALDRHLAEVEARTTAEVAKAKAGEAEAIQRREQAEAALQALDRGESSPIPMADGLRPMAGFESAFKLGKA